VKSDLVAAVTPPGVRDWHGERRGGRQGLTAIADQLSEDFVQPIDNAGELFLGRTSQFAPNTINRQGSDLANLDPGSLGERWGPAF
jgi:hypothetical protein